MFFQFVIMETAFLDVFFFHFSFNFYDFSLFFCFVDSVVLYFQRFVFSFSFIECVTLFVCDFSLTFLFIFLISKSCNLSFLLFAFGDFLLLYFHRFLHFYFFKVCYFSLIYLSSSILFKFSNVEILSFFTFVLWILSVLHSHLFLLFSLPSKACFFLFVIFLSFFLISQQCHLCFPLFRILDSLGFVSSSIFLFKCVTDSWLVISGPPLFLYISVSHLVHSLTFPLFYTVDYFLCIFIFSLFCILEWMTFFFLGTSATHLLLYFSLLIPSCLCPHSFFMYFYSASGEKKNGLDIRDSYSFPSLFV